MSDTKTVVSGRDGMRYTCTHLPGDAHEAAAQVGGLGLDAGLGHSEDILSATQRETHEEEGPGTLQHVHHG